MKKILLSVFAVAALASCAQDEIVGKYNQEAIGFGNAFVDNATKAIDPSYSASNLLKEIFVYGTVTGTSTQPVSIFDYVRVWNDNTNAEDIYNKEWQCGLTQYWVAGADYKFAAVAGIAKDKVQVAEGIPSKLDFTSNGETDLVYGYLEREDVSATNNAMVAFTMSHLLSKVKFTVTNTTNQGTSHDSGYYYKVTGIKFTNAYTAGDYTINNTKTTVDDKVVWTVGGTWATKGTAGEIAFGNATNSTAAGADADAIADRDVVTSNYERLVVPCDYTTNKLNVNLTLALYLNNDSNCVNTDVKDIPVAVNLEPGKAYSFNINVSVGQPIQFTVTSNPTWVEQPSQNIQ